jgi:RNA polymerase sigma-70 factor (ECF subfamily)
LKSLYHRNTVPEEGLPETDAGQSFDDTEYKELVELVNKSIDFLPEKTAIVFKMSRFGGLSNKEIADKLSLSLKTVEYHMTIALKSLRTTLIPYIDSKI